MATTNNSSDPTVTLKNFSSFMATVTEQGEKIAGIMSKFTSLTAPVNKVKDVISTLKTSFEIVSNPIGLATGAITGLVAAIGLLDDYSKTAAARLAEKALSEATRAQRIEDLIKKYEDLEKKEKKQGRLDQKDKDLKRYIANELAALVPTSMTGHDKDSNALIDISLAKEELAILQEQVKKLQYQSVKRERDDRLADIAGLERQNKTLMERLQEIRKRQQELEPLKGKSDFPQGEWNRLKDEEVQLNKKIRENNDKIEDLKTRIKVLEKQLDLIKNNKTASASSSTASSAGSTSSSAIASSTEPSFSSVAFSGTSGTPSGISPGGSALGFNPGRGRDSWLNWDNPGRLPLLPVAEDGIPRRRREGKPREGSDGSRSEIDFPVLKFHGLEKLLYPGSPEVIKQTLEGVIGSFAQRTSIGGAVNTFANAMGKGASPEVAALSALAELAMQTGPIAFLFEKINEVGEPLIEAIGSLLTPAVEGLAIVLQIIKPILDAVAWVAEKIADFWTWLMNGIVKLWNATLGKLFGEMEEFDADRLREYNSQMGQAMQNVVQGLRIEALRFQAQDPSSGTSYNAIQAAMQSVRPIQVNINANVRDGRLEDTPTLRRQIWEMVKQEECKSNLRAYGTAYAPAY